MADCSHGSLDRQRNDRLGRVTAAATLWTPAGNTIPGTNSWTATSSSNAPRARSGHTAVWSGNEMIVWGGVTHRPIILKHGGRYNPVSDSWSATSTTNAPSARSAHTAVWTGNEMIVWGGGNDVNDFNTGGEYCAPSPPSQLGNISTRCLCADGRQRDDWRVHCSRDWPKEGNYSCHRSRARCTSL